MTEHTAQLGHRRRVLPLGRHGSLLVEALVAATILAVIISVITQAHGRLMRLWGDTRNCQLATDELCNQMDRLLDLDPTQRAVEIGSIAVSGEIAEVLPAATMTAELIGDELGQRLRLTINWQRMGSSKPLEMIGWITSTAIPPGGDAIAHALAEDAINTASPAGDTTTSVNPEPQP
ncbi:MAG: hypothetical protein KF752_10995 [Pirellulaceae bacterium]|nr:hypothetical protein [Pirellulaceae bacterium]